MRLKTFSDSTTVRFIRCGISAAFLLLMSSCSTLKVPVERPQFDSNATIRYTSASGIEVRVKPIQDRDEYWSLFDDNLPEAGIAALWISVKNVSDEEIDFTGVKWMLRQGWTDQPSLNGDQVFKIYYRARHIRMYTIETDRRARLAMENLRFQPTRIRASAEQDGFLFFRVPLSAHPDWAGNGTLYAKNLRLKNRRESSLQVPLTHANP